MTWISYISWWNLIVKDDKRIQITAVQSTSPQSLRILLEQIMCEHMKDSKVNGSGKKHFPYANHVCHDEVFGKRKTAVLLYLDFNGP